jgi:general stress protein YciG
VTVALSPRETTVLKDNGIPGDPVAWDLVSRTQYGCSLFAFAPRKGFASLSPEARREAARRGALARLDKYGPHAFSPFARDPELAKRAGAKGGKAAKHKREDQP